MLITCPECKKQISDKSEVCIHCGYPLKEMNNCNNNICNINGIEYDFSDILLDITNNQQRPTVCVRKISDMCNIPIYEAKEIYLYIKNNNALPQNIKCEIEKQSNIPKCPTCGSTDLKPAGILDYIYTTSYGTNTISFICKNCGYKW